MNFAHRLLRSLHLRSPSVGFLWDSLSRNIGDQAIGACVLRLVAREGFDRLVPVAIGRPVVESHELLVIGGGELLHPPGHNYYDLFRVPGPHILSSAGTGGPIDAAYLESYRLVSVRSQADRANLANLERTARVSPCLTVLFDQVAEPCEPIEMLDKPLGMHLHSSSWRRGEGVEALGVLRELSGPKVLLPFTHYNQDGAIQSVLAEHLGWSPPLAITTPDQAFDVIRRLGALVTTSLHATIMAYVAGVPFLAIAYAPKVVHFLAERGLTHRQVASLVEVPGKAGLLEAGSVDWQESLDRDRGAAGELLAAMVAQLENAASGRRRSPREFRRWQEPAAPVESHRSMMRVHEEYGLRAAERMSHEVERQRLVDRCDLLERHLAGLESEIGRVRDYSRGLERQLREVTEELEKAGPYARSLERRLQERDERRDEPTTTADREPR